MKWVLPVELDSAEVRVTRLLKKTGKFYVFLRTVQPKLFDEAFQAELAKAYRPPRGTPPIPPALLAAVTLLQAYDQVSDAEAVETATVDLRWQLVLGCIGAEKAPFSQGVLVSFRERMVEHDLDQKLLDRTVALAKETGLFGWQHLKAMLDSSPLIGAGRVEDTWNLIGRALSTVVDCAAAALSIPREKVLKEAKLVLLSGPSLKATLDINWDDPGEQAAALQRLLGEVAALQEWLSSRAGDKVKEAPLRDALEALARVLEQDLEPDPGGGMRIRHGVARDRMPSLGDKEMRHGRKSQSKRFNGYKRHLVAIGGTDLVAGALVLPANQPEHDALEPLLERVQQHGSVSDLHIDRGYLGSPLIEGLQRDGVAIRAKPWPSRNGGRFTKEDFVIDLKHRQLTCPAGSTARFSGPGSTARFSASNCDPCALRDRCTAAALGVGRSVTIHPQEELLLGLRRDRKTPHGRALLRERVAIEHHLARVSGIQGPRARYKGARKNTLDLRRCAAVANLQALARAA